MRSIPEKTLEHWSSIYLSDRFPNGSLWWPASGEDVLVELPRLAATGRGKTLALELKTTEAVSDKHVLLIDTLQLERYLSPPAGWPPLPVYYVFPLPHWTGPLTSHNGSAYSVLGPMTVAPPKWWRQRAGLPWFGDWLYVMSAQAVASALAPGWRNRKSARLFTLDAPHDPRTRLDWEILFTRTPAAKPVSWKPFWAEVDRWGLFAGSKEDSGGVRWLTTAGEPEQGDLVRVLVSGERESRWPVSELLNRGQSDVRLGAAPDDDRETPGDGGNERVMLHVPDQR